jgi:hypothetical protein
VLRENPYDHAEGGEASSAKARAGCVERSGVLAAFSAFHSLFFLSLALMFFDHRSACEEYGRHSKE